MPLVLISSVLIVVANLVYGKEGGIGVLTGYGRPATWLITLAGIGLCLLAVGLVVNRRIDGVFIDERNKISLSRFQLVLWTSLLVSALLTAGLSNASLGSSTPLQIQIPPSVWSLLGIGSFTFAVTPMMLRRKESGAPPSRMPIIQAALSKEDSIAVENVKARGSVIVKTEVADARWRDIIRGDEGDADFVDVSKVQQLFFTCLLVTVYGSGLMNTMATYGPITRFESVDDGFVALLGLSHAAYLAYKAGPKMS